MPTIQLTTGETIWYQRSGRGTPLLHIHGSAFGHRNFEKLTPCLTDEFEVIDFDLPGYGESRGGAAPKQMSDIADQVHRFLQALGISKISVHGTSFGAMIALTMAARHPQIIDRLIFSCFLARYDNAARMMRQTWKRAARDSSMDAVADLTSVAGFARGFYDRPDAQAQLESMRDAFRNTRPEAFIAGTETIERTDLSSLLPQIKAPTLLLAGLEDNMTPFKPAASGVGFEQIKDLIPAAKLIVIADCGHYLVIEQPERAAEHIVQFLSVEAVSERPARE